MLQTCGFGVLTNKELKADFNECNLPCVLHRHSAKSPANPVLRTLNHESQMAVSICPPMVYKLLFDNPIKDPDCFETLIPPPKIKWSVFWDMHVGVLLRGKEGLGAGIEDTSHQSTILKQTVRMLHAKARF